MTTSVRQELVIIPRGVVHTSQLVEGDDSPHIVAIPSTPRPNYFIGGLSQPINFVVKRFISTKVNNIGHRLIYVMGNGLVQKDVRVMTSFCTQHAKRAEIIFDGNKTLGVTIFELKTGGLFKFDVSVFNGIAAAYKEDEMVITKTSPFKIGVEYNDEEDYNMVLPKGLNWSLAPDVL